MRFTGIVSGNGTTKTLLLRVYLPILATLAAARPALARLGTMTKTLTAEIQRKHAERQLFVARRTLGHLVELYDSGQWRNFYKEKAFAEAVREARQAVDRWTGMVAKVDNTINS
jgi:hypothetical protein